MRNWWGAGAVHVDEGVFPGGNMHLDR